MEAVNVISGNKELFEEMKDIFRVLLAVKRLLKSVCSSSD